MLIWAFLIFFIGFTCAILLGRAFRKGRERVSDEVIDKRQELEQILARHAAAKANKDNEEK